MARHESTFAALHIYEERIRQWFGEWEGVGIGEDIELEDAGPTMVFTREGWVEDPKWRRYTVRFTDDSEPEGATLFDWMFDITDAFPGAVEL